jgi:hypothetical protein
LEHRDHPLGHASVAHAEHLAPDAGGVGHRTEVVEDRGDAELAPGGTGVAHRRMEPRGEAEPDAGVGHAARHTGGSQVDLHTERLEQVGRSTGGRGGTVAVLAHTSTGARHHEGGDRRHVDGVAAVTARATRVDQGAELTRIDRDALGHRQHGLEQPTELVDGFALHAQRHDESGDLRRARLAAEDLGHGGPGLLPGQVRARREGAEDGSPAAQVGEQGRGWRGGWIHQPGRVPAARVRRCVAAAG